VLGASIVALIGLTGCGGGDSIDELKAETTTVRPASKIMFDPTAGVLPLPTDLLFSLAGQTQDDTLELPAEVAGKANGGTPDFGDPEVVLGAQDGWSTQQAFVISTAHPTGISLDAASVSTPGAVRLFKGAIGGDLHDPDCTFASPLTGCKVNEELVFRVDFVSQAQSNDIAIIPLRPFPGSTTIYVVLTDALQASDGDPLQASTTYALVKQPIATLPNFVAPLSGTEALATLIGLPGVSSTTPGNGIVRFTTGSHSSLLSPTPSAATTREMQIQIALFFASTQLGQSTIVITNTDVVAN
jgi:hypothetical protein